MTKQIQCRDETAPFLLAHYTVRDHQDKACVDNQFSVRRDMNGSKPTDKSFNEAKPCSHPRKIFLNLLQFAEAFRDVSGSIDHPWIVLEVVFSAIS